jgi:hypothetical protein
MDIIYIGAMLGFLAITLGISYVCERLGGRT